MGYSGETDPPPRAGNCTHYDCRCARALELAQLADRTGDARYLRDAIDAHDQEVRCRRQPGGGSHDDSNAARP